MSLAKWRFCGLAVCAGILSILTGCASVTVGTTQTVKVETLASEGKAVEGAECELMNDKGKAQGISGQVVPVRRSGGDLSVSCTLAGYPPAAAQVVSRANAGLAGNILIGGGIGAAIDVGTGAAYTYPTWVQLVFGEERLFDRSGNRTDAPSSGTLIRVIAEPGAPVRIAAAPVATPTPVPTAGPGLATAEPMTGATGLTSALRRGDALEYVLTDLMTGNSTKVVYNVDRVMEDEISFNGGSRVEKLNGQVVSIRSPTGGYFDASSPPGGWGRPDLKPGMRWQADYIASTGDKWRHELQATVTGTNTRRVEGVELRLTRIDWEGWIYAALAPQPVGTRFKATVLYADALKRVISFEAEHRPAFGSSRRESLELARVWR